MDWRVLGPVEVTTGDGPVALGGAKPRLLLAVLLAHHGRVVPLDVLVDALWGEHPPPTAPQTVQTHVSRLRRALGSTTPHNRPAGYELTVPDDARDSARVEHRLAAATDLLGTDPARAGDAAAAALAEWRGPAFGEFAAVAPVRPEATRLEGLRLAAHELDVDARLDCGRHRETVGVLETLVTEHPLHERFWARLVLALHRSGRTPEALARARDLRVLLREELGLDPSSEIRLLEADILAGRPELDWTPPRTSASVAAPRPATGPEAGSTADDLVGRDDDLRVLGGLLADGRAVTVIGPGGVGKTRLVRELLARRPDLVGDGDGVRLVELAPLRDPRSVVAAVAAGVDVRRRPERSLEDSIIDVLAPREVLLVIDNCEHVLDAAADLVGAVLRHCPRVRVLATSRAALGLPGEITWGLPPLGLPATRGADPDEVVASPAGALFAARAAAARPGFVVADDTAGSVAEICRRLDGMPLALELAAARVRSMTVADLAGRLDGRFRLLAGRRDGDPRHRALVDVVTWSFDLLGPDEQELFTRLAVFAGAVDLDRIEAVCSGDGIAAEDVAGLLVALVDQSMVVAAERGGRMRYHLLETLREFARERLDAGPGADARRERHARTVLDAARAAARDLGGPDELRGVRAFENDVDDLREASRRRLAAGDLDSALALVAATREFAFRTVRDEVFGWARSVSDAPGAADHPLYPVVRAVVGYGRFVRGDLAPALEAAREAIDAADRLGVPTGALAERVLVNAHFFRREPDEALAAAARMLEQARASGDDALIAHAAYMASVAHTSTGDPTSAAALADEADRAARRCGSPTARAQARYAAGLACERRDPDRAVALLQESAAVADGVGNRWLRAFARTEELAVRARLQDPAGTAPGFRDVVDTWFRGGDWANQWLSLRHVVGLFATLRLDETAAVLAGAIEAAGADVALPFDPVEAARTPDLLAGVRARLGDDAFSAALARGHALPDEAVVRLALRCLGTVGTVGTAAPVTPSGAR